MFRVTYQLVLNVFVFNVTYQLILTYQLMLTIYCVRRNIATHIILEGTTPGPVMFGVIVDSACVVWQDSTCGERGVCWLFRQENLSLRIMAWWIGLKLCGAAVYGVASLVYKPSEAEEARDDSGEGQSGL